METELLVRREGICWREGVRAFTLGCCVLLLLGMRTWGQWVHFQDRTDQHVQWTPWVQADPQEKDLVTSTCSNLTDQLAHVRHLLEQKKMAVSCQ